MLFAITGSLMMVIIMCYITALIFIDDRHIIADAFLYIFNKNNLIKTKKIASVKPIAVNETTCLMRILREIDRKHIITALVFNRHNEVIGTVDEYKVIKYVLNYGAHAVVRELIN
jgi:predicted transcriptional regulator